MKNIEFCKGRFLVNCQLTECPLPWRTQESERELLLLMCRIVSAQLWKVRHWPLAKIYWHTAVASHSILVANWAKLNFVKWSATPKLREQNQLTSICSLTPPAWKRRTRGCNTIPECIDVVMNDEWDENKTAAKMPWDKNSQKHTPCTKWFVDERLCRVHRSFCRNCCAISTSFSRVKSVQIRSSISSDKIKLETSKFIFLHHRQEAWCPFSEVAKDNSPFTEIGG